MVNNLCLFPVIRVSSQIAGKCPVGSFHERVKTWHAYPMPFQILSAGKPYYVVLAARDHHDDTLSPYENYPYTQGGTLW